MQNLLTQWLAFSWLESAGFVLTLAGIALAARNVVLTWPLQMLAGVIYVVLFCQYQLFGEAALNGLYVLLAAYGWRAWRRSGEVPVLPISRMGRGELVLFWGVGVLGTLLVAQLQLHFLPTALPWLDSAVFVFGVLAQWLQARRKLWNWPVWIVLDLLAAGIYFYKALSLTGLLYLLLAALAAYGWWDWRRLMRGQGGA
ncbi:nicotinamide mononucleotide transporter family protein [Chitinimonas sp.]|uniref:nicotinamide mononucleotide transporter family protein n=1 Tax=Chitinimonas sp. TaxID=1934313 RepID=UPI002F947998